MAVSRRPTPPVVYPEEDGKVSESDKHLTQALQLIAALRLFFAGRTDVFVGGNLFVYYREGDPKKCFSPDVLVAFGVPARPSEERGSFRVWEEGVLPAVVIELTSSSTRRQDTVEKPRLYATLGVQEYYLFDPLGEFLEPRLQGYRLNTQERYTRLTGEALDSPALGLRLVVQDGWLRLWNPVTGALLPTLEEAEAGRRAAEAALQQERASRLAADAEIARLRAELARREKS